MLDFYHAYKYDVICNKKFQIDFRKSFHETKLNGWVFEPVFYDLNV